MTKEISIREFKLNDDKKIEIINHLNITDLPAASHATVDKNEKYMAFVTGKK